MKDSIAGTYKGSSKAICKNIYMDYHINYGTCITDILFISFCFLPRDSYKT